MASFTSLTEPYWSDNECEIAFTFISLGTAARGIQSPRRGGTAHGGAGVLGEAALRGGEPAPCSRHAEWPQGQDPRPGAPCPERRASLCRASAICSASFQFPNGIR